MSYDCHLVIQEDVELYLSPPILCLCPVSVKQWVWYPFNSSSGRPILGCRGWGSGNVVDIVSMFAPAGSALNDGWRMCSVWWGSGEIRVDVVPRRLVEVDREACMSVGDPISPASFGSTSSSGFQQEFGIRGFGVEWGDIGRGVACKKGKLISVLRFRFGDSYSRESSFVEGVCGSFTESFKLLSLKLWSVRKSKVETVKDQSSHSIKTNHRGRDQGSRVSKQTTGAAVKVQEAHKLQEGHACKEQVEAVAIGPAGVSLVRMCGSVVGVGARACRHGSDWRSWVQSPILAISFQFRSPREFPPDDFRELGIPMAVDFVLCHIWK
ncbi:hypothetical protein B0F90DRAFT_1869454 [Multifurca ochricompacta]|uniref:Uncharacterized protein n=1 Tax=Multifurca ochricompacta TaxID=376703 RepID=A0AAD4LTD4_9AGAM|nr:hypothetical protein B0F90DRAFT_1869454 [Multifurca ochricompacta]